ncbi:MAG TPA: bifunctional riboflavin kinase/FAD synthetase [bacterium]|nr:bifunctional riboflavin kinase/FAD synthetase [bacterium]
MRRAFGLADWPATVRAPVLALGTFDGVHLGHRRVIGLAVERARARGGPAAVLTFEPHPLEVLRPAAEPVLLTTIDERLDLFASLGVDVALVLPFDETFARISASAWLDDVLRARLDAREIVAGSSYTFGFRREGTARRLLAWGRAADVPVHLEPAVLAGGEPVTSTRIRATLREGLVEDAARLLGRPYGLTGPVVRGEGRGRTIGVPTANLAVGPRKIVPAHGVYATMATVGARRYRAATNVGTRPTFGGTTLSVETFLLDFDGECLGEPMSLEFVRRVREERTFPDAATLVRQIGDDVAAVRELLRDQ